ncbi:MAG: hypothetical protein HC842_04465 [Cytophagales bacterium]|nr:hypothetical protein [Cytophagales bacterium]
MNTQNMEILYRNKYRLVLLVLAFSTSCTELLEREPLDIIGDEAVWSDPNLIKGYLLGLYDKAPTRRDFHGGFPWDNSWNDQNAEGAFEPGFYTTYSDEARSGYNWTGSVLRNVEGFVRATSDLNYWNYELIRECNFMITKIETGRLPEAEKATYKQRHVSFGLWYILSWSNDTVVFRSSWKYKI